MNYDFGIMRAPSCIIFGKGQVAALGTVAAELGRRVLVCTDERIAGIELLENITTNLEAHGLEVRVFSGTQPELPIENVEECIKLHKQFSPDVIVGLGGGSCLDLAKLVSLWLAHEGPLSTYYGELKVPGPIFPVIAVPTTSGTGSEVTPVAVLADNARELKVGISSPHMIPTAAICDPELTVSCPPFLTALSGGDALTHAIEAISATRRAPNAELSSSRVFVGKNALSDVNAMAAIRLIFTHLETAVAHPDDLEARSAVMMASTLAGLAFGAAGTSAAHAIQYPIGALSKSAHGLGVAVLLPHAMRFNIDSAKEVFASIAREISLASADVDDDAASRLTIDAVADLLKRIGIPADLAELGVDASQSEWIAEHSMLATRLVENNPRMLDENGVLEILSGAFASEPGTISQ